VSNGVVFDGTSLVPASFRILARSLLRE